MALGKELAARGHDVCFETFVKWREDAEREGMEFAAAPEYDVFPTRGRHLKPYEAAVRAAGETAELIRRFDPEVVVADILTVAGGLAAEMEGRPCATLIPHVYPVPEPGLPPYSIGARMPRTALGFKAWALMRPLLGIGERQGREELNGARERVGLPPIERVHGGISRRLAIVATFPQLEYPRQEWHPSLRVTGPLMWERPYGETDPPGGEQPLVLVAPSTIQDPEHRMVAAALDGLADEPVRVLATTNRREPPKPLVVPGNARLVDWVSYAKTMPKCDVVVCHAGHGTVARSLSCGVPVVACPEAGDMAENAARVAWAGCGVSLPRRLATPRGVRLAVRKVLGDPGYRARAERLAQWAERFPGPAIAAAAVERMAPAS